MIWHDRCAEDRQVDTVLGTPSPASRQTVVGRGDAPFRGTAQAGEQLVSRSRTEPRSLAARLKTAAGGAHLTALNDALARADAAALQTILGEIARSRSMSHLARDTGASRASLYRSLSADGDPRLSTMLRVLSSLGLRLVAKAEHDLSEP